MLKVNFIQLFFIILFFNACKESYQKPKMNGALEALQLLSSQKTYPNEDLKGANYFDEIKKWQINHTIENREELPEPWQSIGPHNIAGRTLCLAINPQNNKTIYAGSASGGLWRSYNKGLDTSWQQIPLGFPVLGVSSIAFAPNDSLTIYIGTGEVYNINLSGHGAAYRSTRGTYGMGILKSSDGGSTWRKSLDWTYELQRAIHVIKVAPSNPNIIYAGTTHGTYVSKNAGNSWELIHDTPLCNDLVVHPNNPNDLIIACGNFGSPGKGIYHTQDGGENWDFFEPSNFQGKIQLAQYDPKPEIVYASIGNGFGFDDGATWIYKTSNRALNWDLQGTTDYSQWQGWFAHDIAIHPYNSQFLTMVGIEIFQSQNSGKTATQITNGGVAFGTPPIGQPDGPSNFTHSDHHDVIYDPSDENTIYVATDGGVYGTFDGGEKWQSLNGGYQTTQFYNGFSVFNSENISLAMGGLQDNSTVEFTGSKAWKRVIGGDGSWSAIHPTDSKIRYGSLQNLTVYKTNNGISYNRIFIPGADLATAFIAPFVVSQSDPETIYAGRSAIFKSLNGGTSWNKSPLNTDFALSMDVYSQNPDIMYVATAAGDDRPRIYVTTDGANTFSDITLGLPNQYINDIIINENDPNKVYVTLGGFGDAQVFKTTDSGQEWIDITGELPKIPTSAILIDPLDDNLLYLGNDFGIFYSEDDGENWFNFSQGITDAALIMDLKINPATRKIFAATHGNGAFERDMISRELPSKTIDSPYENVRIVENPTNNYLTIVGYEPTIQEMILEIISIDGKIFNHETVNTNGVDRMRIDLDKLISSGQYFLKISSSDGIKVLPFIFIK